MLAVAHPGIEAVALAVRKRRRWCTVAKRTYFLDEPHIPILAVCWRSQPGTERVISLPESVLAYARASGCERFYLADERAEPHRLFTCSLDVFERAPLAADGERYVALAALAEVPYRRWKWAERAVQVETGPAGGTAQLALFPCGGEGAV